MRYKQKALTISAGVLFLAGLMDLIRGIAHTFNMKYSAVHRAGIELLPDSLYLMGAFGISNFLTGLLYWLVVWKARHLAPYVLFIIPVAYLVGGLGMATQQIEPQGQFIGRYIMAVYLSVCVVTAGGYFVASAMLRKPMATA